MNVLRRGGLAAVFAALLLAGCGGGSALPTPEFVGDWSAPGVNLSIAADGALAWRKVDERGNSHSVVAPLRSFSPKQFSAGIWLFSTRFKVDQPPVRDGAVWRMTVDGVELIRPAEGPVLPQNEV
jgi:hypothetical protein